MRTIRIIGIASYTNLRGVQLSKVQVKCQVHVLTDSHLSDVIVNPDVVEVMTSCSDYNVEENYLILPDFTQCTRILKS